MGLETASQLSTIMTNTDRIIDDPNKSFVDKAADLGRLYMAQQAPDPSHQEGFFRSVIRTAAGVGLGIGLAQAFKSEILGNDMDKTAADARYHRLTEAARKLRSKYNADVEALLRAMAGPNGTVNPTLVNAAHYAVSQRYPKEKLFESEEITDPKELARYRKKYPADMLQTPMDKIAADRQAFRYGFMKAACEAGYFTKTAFNPLSIVVDPILGVSTASRGLGEATGAAVGAFGSPGETDEKITRTKVETELLRQEQMRLEAERRNAILKKILARRSGRTTV